MASVLARAAGRVAGRGGSGRARDAGMQDAMVQLEPRVLLSGDAHADLFEVQNGEREPTAIFLDVNGEAVVQDETVITQMDDDVFSFTAPATDFVTVLADTINTGEPTLDSKVEIYTRNEEGDLIRLVSGDDNGTLDDGIFVSDGWAGFIAEEGVEYLVRVLGQDGTLGGYILRVDALSTATTIDPTTGRGLNDSELFFPQDDEVFRISTDSDGVGVPASFFDTLAHAVGRADFTELDTRLEIYDASATLIAADEQAAYINSAFATWRGAPDTDFYVRVRSDEIGDPTETPSTGEFTLDFDMAASILRDGDGGVDPVTRIGTDGLDLPPGEFPFAFADKNEAYSFQFFAEGTGLTFVTANPSIPIGPNLTIRLFNEAGEQIGFANDTVGLTPEIRIELIGGQRYFVTVDGFEDALPPPPPFPPLPFTLVVEAHHTFDEDLPVDDHADIPNEWVEDDFDVEPGSDQFQNLITSGIYDRVRRDFLDATPLRFGEPGLVAQDRGLVHAAQGRGRIWDAADTDLFSFVPPVDMLSDHDQNDDNAGQSLFVGGQFTSAGPGASNGLGEGLRELANIGIWDGLDWWSAGPGLDGTVYASTIWDPDGDGDAWQDTLFVAGEFTALNGADPAFAPIHRIAYYNVPTQQWLPITDPFGTVLGVMNDLDNDGEDDGDGVVRALEVFDDDQLATDATAPSLFLGGRFSDAGDLAGAPIGANNIVKLDWVPNPFNPADGVFTFSALAGGVDGDVYALQAFDDQNAPEGFGGEINPKLYVGGDFFAADGVEANNLAWWGTPIGSDQDMAPAEWGLVTDYRAIGDENIGAPLPGAQFGVDGPVHALEVYAEPDPANPGQLLPETLYIGGGMTGGLLRLDLVFVDPDEDVEGDESFVMNRNIFGAITGGDATVYALHSFDPNDNALGTVTPALMIGGSFTSVGGTNALNIAAYGVDGGFLQNNAGFTGIGAGLDGTVRAFSSFVDEEFNVGTGNSLYVGGEFTASGALVSNHIIRFESAGGAYGFRGAFEGTDDAVFTLAGLDDDIEGAWDRNDRARTRAQIVVGGAGPDNFGNYFVNVYDSNFRLVYSNDTIAAPFPDPAGGRDPSLSGSEADDEILTVDMWGGETYYVEVSTNGRGTGRYNLSVLVDAMPDVDPMTGLRPNNVGFMDINDPNQTPLSYINFFAEEPDAGNWANALRIGLDENFTGDGTINAGTIAASPPPNLLFLPFPVGNQTVRPSIVTPSGVLRGSGSDLGSLHSIDDTDLFQFTARQSGTVEIVIATSFLQDEYLEYVYDLDDASIATTTKTKTYSSNLDSALRVFDNDFVELAYNNDNQAVDGLWDDTAVGSIAARLHTRDARIVIPVVQGERYFVQVESGQLFNADGDMRDNVDWRFATGAYQLIVNATPVEGNDDHPERSPTPIVIDLDPESETFGSGSITGEIDNNIFNPNDADIFEYRVPASGLLNLTVTPDNPGEFQLDVALADADGLLATATIQPDGSATITDLAIAKGDQLFIIVDASGEAGGTYTVQVDGPTPSDDFADAGAWSLAAPLQDNTFFRRVEVGGDEQERLEEVGDSDLFTFTALDYDFVTATLTGLAEDASVRMTIYEINRDGADNPNFLRIAYTTGDGGGAESVRFSVSNNRPYYVLVEGVDPERSVGEYDVVIEYTKNLDDHPNFFNLPVASVIDLDVNQSTGIGVGAVPGTIERETDDDLFRFRAPNDSSGVVTVTTEEGSPLTARIDIYDASGQDLLATVETDAEGVATLNLDSLVRDEEYLISVVPTGGSTGAYRVAVATEPIDDHADIGEFALATRVELNSETGKGQTEGVILPVDDTDLFTFDALADGRVTIDVRTPDSGLSPRIRVFNAVGLELSGGATNGQDAFFEFNADNSGQTFYFAVVGEGVVPGAYEVEVLGQISSGGEGEDPDDPVIPDDHPNAGQFDRLDASNTIALNSKTGDGQLSGQIEYIGDSDLLQFTALPGDVFVQVVTPFGSAIDVSVKIFNESRQLIAEDGLGIPGVSAAVGFKATIAGTFFVLVEQVDVNLGSYTVRVDTEPGTHFLYYPEGFASPTISEFVPIVNPNSFDVNFQVIARYEVGDRDEIIANGVIPANARGGITVNDPTTTLVRQGVPYAIEIQSNGQLGATLSHYDFNITTGESFTNQPSTEWTFAEATKDSANFRDFLVFYNTTENDAKVDITLYYDSGEVVTFSRSVEAFRRGGVNFDQDLEIQNPGTFAIKVTADQEIVAALTSFNISQGYGAGQIGDPNGGVTEGVFASVASGEGVDTRLSFANTGDDPAVVTIRAEYLEANLPDLVRVINIDAASRTTIDMAGFGIVSGERVGVRFESNVKVTASATEVTAGDANSTNAGSEAGTTFIFGDAFVNPDSAGVDYVERLSFYNPSKQSIDVTITFLFPDGSSDASTVVTVPAESFATHRVDQNPVILGVDGLAFFSIQLDSVSPFVTQFTHYDFFLGGGWGALGAPIGLTNPIAMI